MQDKKVNVGRFKAKSRYQKSKGYRQPLSVVKVESISTKAETPVKHEKVEKKKEPVTETEVKVVAKTKAKVEFSKVKTKKIIEKKPAAKVKKVKAEAK